MTARAFLALAAILLLAAMLAPTAGARDVRTPGRSAHPLQLLRPLAAPAPLGRVGSVRFIKRGLQVQPPKQQPQSGKVKQPLYIQYNLQTQAQELASVAFNDGSVLHMNQRTDVVLAGAHQSVVKQGEVDQLVVPGTDHQVRTPSAVASAIGTQLDVRVTGNLTVITVTEGAVLVSTPYGSVTVTTGEQTSVQKGQAPASPVAVAAAHITTWDTALPPPSPPTGENIGLTANGGGAVLASSQRASSDGAWNAGNIDDGRLDTGWASAPGRTNGEWVMLAFGGGAMHTITGIAVDCAATRGLPDSADLHEFIFSTSSSGTDPADFQTGHLGICRQQTGLQRFALLAPVSARAVELTAVSNYGSTDAVSVAELEVVSPDAVDTSLPPPSPIATTATPTDTPTATSTATPSPTLTPTDTPTPAPTDTPTPAPTPTSVVALSPPKLSAPVLRTLPQPVPPLGAGGGGGGYTFTVQLATINQYCAAPSSCAGKLDLTLENPVMTATVCGALPWSSGWTGTIHETYIDDLHGGQVGQDTYTFGPVTLNANGRSLFFRGRLSAWYVTYASGVITLEQVFDVPPGTLLSNGAYADSSVPQAQTVRAPLEPLTKCP
jgi:hypothetical protein